MSSSQSKIVSALLNWCPHPGELGLWGAWQTHSRREKQERSSAVCNELYGDYKVMSVNCSKRNRGKEENFTSQARSGAQWQRSPRMHKALGSIPSPERKRKREGGGREEGRKEQRKEGRKEERLVETEIPATQTYRGLKGHGSSNRVPI
jgi:hypothetical protein